MRPVLFFPLLLLAFYPPCASGQSRLATASTDPVRLVEIIGPQTLTAGMVVHFRARAIEGAAQPVNYRWDLGDGTESIGSLVSHVYSAPGRYTLTVIARNETSADTLQTQVRVLPPVLESVDPEVEAGEEPELERVASTVQTRPVRHSVSQSLLFGSGGISPENGGYTWVLGTDLWPERAQERMRIYRLQGFRADIVEDISGRGSSAHRIVAGQFTTPDEALAARPWLPKEATGVWLLPLSRAAD